MELSEGFFWSQGLQDPDAHIGQTQALWKSSLSFLWKQTLPLAYAHSPLILYMELIFRHRQENVKKYRTDGKIKQQQNLTSPRCNGLAELDTN